MEAQVTPEEKRDLAHQIIENKVYRGDEAWHYAAQYALDSDDWSEFDAVCSVLL